MTNFENTRSACRRFMLSLGVVAVALFAASAKAQNAAALPPEPAALLDRAAIEDLLVDYYAQIGTGNHDYSRRVVTSDGGMPEGLLQYYKSR